MNVKIAVVGFVRLNTHIMINNVLYILDFRINLFSISQLTKDLDSRVYFDENCYVIEHIKGSTIGQDRRIAGLYVLDNNVIFLLIHNLHLQNQFLVMYFLVLLLLLMLVYGTVG